MCNGIWRWNAIAFQINALTKFFKFYLSFPSWITQITSFYRTMTVWDEDSWRRAERIQIFEDRRGDGDLLNHGHLCVMCILLCFIIYLFKSLTSVATWKEKVKKSRRLLRFYQKNLSWYVLNLKLRCLYCRHIASFF